MIGATTEKKKVDSFDQFDEDDFERERDGTEPDCVRFILETPVSKFGPMYQAIYERVLGAHPDDSEFPKVAAFGTWARGKKGKPVCLYVIALAINMQQHHDEERALDSGLLAGTHAHFPLPGVWVASLLRKYGIRPDLGNEILAKRVYDVLKALRKVGVLRLEVKNRYAEKLANEFTVWTLTELEAERPAAVPSVYSERNDVPPTVTEPTAEPQDAEPVAKVVERIDCEARAVCPDDPMTGFEYQLGAIKHEAENATDGSERQREFQREYDRVNGYLHEIKRYRFGLNDSADCAERKFRDPVPVDLTGEPVPV